MLEITLDYAAFEKIIGDAKKAAAAEAVKQYIREQNQDPNQDPNLEREKEALQRYQDAFEARRRRRETLALVTCPLCGRDGLTPAGLKVHTSRMHSKSKGKNEKAKEVRV